MPERLIYKNNDGVHLEIVIELSHYDYKHIGKLFNFQISTFCFEEDFANIVHRSLDFVFFFNEH